MTGWRGDESGPQQVAAQQHDAHQRQQDDAELRLDERRHDGQRGRSLRIAAHQRRDGEQRDQRAEGVGLAPDRGVVPADRVEHVQRGGDEGHLAGVAARLTRHERTSWYRMKPTTRSAMIGGNLMSAAVADTGSVLAERRQKVPEATDEPQYV